MLDKERVKVLYVRGYNAVEIAKKETANVEAVRKCIQRNFNHLKKKHEIAVTQRRETLKAVNYEATKFISDKSFIQKNRSAYKTLSNGDIVVNKEVAPVVPWDMPKRLVNENKCII